MNDFNHLITATGMTASQFYELMKTAMRDVLAEAHPDALPAASPEPEYISAAEAAGMLRYRSTRTLKKFHIDGRLKPIRRNRKALYYKRSEVVALQKALFGSSIREK